MMQMTDEMYRAKQRDLGAIGGSDLGAILTSLAHWQARKAQPSNVYMVRGSAIHCAALEPDEFHDRYPQKPEVYKDAEGFDALRPAQPIKGDDGLWRVEGVEGSFALRKHAKAASTEPPAGPWRVDSPALADVWYRTKDEANWAAGEGMTAAEYETVVNTANAVRTHPVAAELLDGAECESVVFWTDAESGVECCAKADVWHPGRRILADIKTVNRVVEPKDAAKWIASGNIHTQMAHYAAGVAAATGTVPDEVWIIAVETSEPHAVACYRLGAEFMDVGHDNRAQALERIAAWDRAAPMPAPFGLDVIDLSPPSWLLPAEPASIAAWRADVEKLHTPNFKTRAKSSEKDEKNTPAEENIRPPEDNNQAKQLDAFATHRGEVERPIPGDDKIVDVVRAIDLTTALLNHLHGMV